MKITITAHPNSKNPRIEKDIFDSLHVYIHEPPLKGKANHAIRLALADHFHTKKSNVLLISGEKSKIKIFEVN
jgi:uncharacterized protein